MTRAHTLLSRLDGLIERGEDSWYARCPAHDDRSPSLSVRDTDETILIHCHAGCHTEDVLAAVDLTFRDLYPADRAPFMHAAHGRRLKLKFDPLQLERTVLRLAEEDMESGRELSVEDRARVTVALARLRGAT